MRFLVPLVSLFAVVAVGVALVVRASDDEPERTTSGTLTLVGDSLNVGVEPYLHDALTGWRVVANDRVGRSTAEGVAELAKARPTLSSHLVVSLGTNDSPTELAAFRARVARVVGLAGRDRCIVWATIWRDGQPNSGFNDVLRGAAAANRRFRVVDWAAMVQREPDLLAGDGVHGSERGYRERAQAIASAVESCRAGQTPS